MTPKELRLNYKAKKLTFERDPENKKAKAEYETAKKALEAANAAVQEAESKAEETPKAAPKAASKAASKAKEAPAEEPKEIAVTNNKPEGAGIEEDSTKKNPEQ